MRDSTNRIGSQTVMQRRLLPSIVAMVAVILPGQVSHVRAQEHTNSIAGLYVGIDRVISGSYSTRLTRSYLYLFPDGTFYDGFIPEGYDGFNLVKYLRTQHPLRVNVDSGRYTVHESEVVFHYAGGTEEIIQLEGEALQFGLPRVRQPNCDGLKLSGTYKPVDIGNAGITFTPDGRFIDPGVMAFLPLSSASRPAPGSGTYSIKNFTLTLRYAHGATFHTFFYVQRNAQGDLDTNALHIDKFILLRQGGSAADQTSIVPTHLPKIETPPGWKSQHDPIQKSTNLVPPNLPQNRVVAVAISDPQRLPNPDVARFPSQFHDRAVQETVKNYVSDGWRVAQAMSRERQGQTLSSTGAFTLPDGKKWWVTVTHLLSSTEWQFVLFMSDGEDLHKTYLPTVRAMLGDGSPSSAARTASLSTASPGPLKVTLPPHWKAEYNSNDKVTTFLPPEVPSGRVVFVQIADPEQTTSSSARFHDEAVQGMTKSFTGGLEGELKREDSQNVASSTGVFMNQHGKRVWVTLFTSVSGIEGHGGVLLTDGEDLHQQYLPTVKAMIADVAGQ